MTQGIQKRPSSPKQAAACSGPLDRLLRAEMFRVLCEPTRARLVSCIARCGRACSVGEVAECCSVDLSVVSRHLAALAHAGILDSHKDGRVVRYRVRYADLSKHFRSLAEAFDVCRPDGDSGGCCETR